MSRCRICGSKLKLCFKKPKKYISTLPSEIKETKNRDFNFGYLCLMCDKIDSKKVCLICNHSGNLALMYHNKCAEIKKIKSLREVFTKDESLYIAKNLTDEEKDIIYANFEDSQSLIVYPRISHFFAYIITGILLYAMFFSFAVFAFQKKRLEIAYSLNGFSNCVFSLFISQAFLSVLFPRGSISKQNNLIRASIGFSICLLYTIFITLFINKFKTAMFIGFGVIGLIFIISIIYELFFVLYHRIKL